MPTLQLLDRMQDDLDRLRETAEGLRFHQGETLSTKAWRAKRVRVYERTQGRCWYCGIQLTLRAGRNNSYQVSYLQPRLSGGCDAECNLVPACEPCDQRKGQRPLEEHRVRLGWQDVGVEPFTNEQIWYLSKHGIIVPAPPRILFWGEPNEVENGTTATGRHQRGGLPALLLKGTNHDNGEN